MKFKPLAKPSRLNQKGQALTEYTTLLVLVALVGVGAAKSVGSLVRKKMMKAREHINADINFDEVQGP